MSLKTRINTGFLSKFPLFKLILGMGIIRTAIKQNIVKFLKISNNAHSLFPSRKPPHITLTSRKYFYNIFNTALQFSADSLDNSQIHRFISSKLCQCSIAYPNSIPQLCFVHMFIYQHFPQSVIANHLHYPFYLDLTGTFYNCLVHCCIFYVVQIPHLPQMEKAQIHFGPSHMDLD